LLKKISVTDIKPLSYDKAVKIARERFIPMFLVNRNGYWYLVQKQKDKNGKWFN